MDVPAVSKAMHQSALKENVGLTLMNTTMENQVQAADTMV